MRHIKYLLGLVVLLVNINFAFAKSEVVIKVENSSGIDRAIETVEVEWNLLAAKGLKADQTIVLDADGNEIPSQIIKSKAGEAQQLIFQVQLDADADKAYTIKKGKPVAYPTKVYGKMVPTRYNDFAWENDVMAYRIYHSDLIPIDGPSGGIDVWSKRTSDLIVDKWYKDGGYHHDHGQGCDFYKVGPSLGAGGISLLEDGKMQKHANYTDAKIIASGPIRLIVEFSFAEQSVNGKTVAMTKTLSLDAGSSLNRFDVVFDTELKELPLTTGIVKRSGKGQVCMNEELGCIMYWEPEYKTYGHAGLAIIMTEASTMGTLENHIVAYDKATPNKAYTYYSGACWDKAEHFNTPKEWKAYLQLYKQQLTKPLKVTVE